MMAQRAWPSRFALLAVLAAAGCACRLDLPQTTISSADTFLDVEIAADPHARACGLAYRDHLPEAQGMLFVLPEPTEVAFWMGETRMPLSIAFLSEQGEVLEIRQARPSQRRERYRSPGPARYVVEANIGWFERNRITAGTVFDIQLPESVEVR